MAPSTSHDAHHFSPPWYLRSGHLQTVITAMRRPKPKLRGTRSHIVPLGEAGATYIYEDAPLESTERSSTAFVMLHGLGSSHAGTYMASVARHLVDRGQRVIRVDLPGSGLSAPLTWLPAHAGCDAQVRMILDWCYDHLGITRWHGIGFSLGGNILLNVLSHFASTSEPAAAPRWSFGRSLAVAPPIDLAACCDGMNRGLNRWYARYFLKVLAREARQRAQHWPQWRALLDARPMRTIRDFDHRYTAPLAGYASADDYYARASSGPRLDSIRTETILLCDRHDPIVPARLFSSISNPLLRMHWTRRGGHLGYLFRDERGRLKRWADQWIADQLMEPDPASPASHTSR